MKILSIKRTFPPRLSVGFAATSISKTLAATNRIIVWLNEAERICTIEECMQNISPHCCGASNSKGTDYIIRKLQPSSDKINFEMVKNKNVDLTQVISDMVVLTASAQLRGAGRKGSAKANELIDFGNNKDWQTEILSFSKDCAAEIKNYYAAYLADYKKEIL